MQNFILTLSGTSPLKHNFSLNGFTGTREALAYAERFDSMVTCASDRVSQLFLGFVLLGCAAVLCLSAMFDNHGPHIAVTLNLRSHIKISL